jgi:KaiC/GvpD/RAD55 family RecA-like ATPase
MKSGKEKERLSVDEVEKIANSLEEIAVANRKYKKKLHELLYDV